MTTGRCHIPFAALLLNVHLINSLFRSVSLRVQMLFQSVAQNTTYNEVFILLYPSVNYADAVKTCNGICPERQKKSEIKS